MSRPPYGEALRQSGLMTILAPFDPHVAGTPPLELDLPDSDIDILCRAPDFDHFGSVLTTALGSQPGFTLAHKPRWPALICTFTTSGWPFEIFGQAIPVAQQHGWRHFRMEQRLLALGGPTFKAAIIALRETGLKTEPAFAAVLGLEGDPYAALLELEAFDDEALVALFP